MPFNNFLLFPSLLGIHLSTLLTQNQSIIQLTAILTPSISLQVKKNPTKNETLEERGTRRKETTNAC
jgi:hypothetical protein